jgi:hypothetical protein
MILKPLNLLTLSPTIKPLSFMIMTSYLLTV